MPDEPVEAGAVAGGGDDRVRRDARAVGEQDVLAVEAVDRGDDLDGAAADGADDADVEDRRRPGREERGTDAVLGAGEALRGEVGDRELPLRDLDRVDPRRRQVADADPDQLCGDAGGRAPDDLRRCAHRQPRA